MVGEVQAYQNGHWLSRDQITITLDDLGFTMGITVVERLRTFGGQLFQPDLHLARMKRSFEIMGWNTTALGEEIRQALDGFLERNGKWIAAGDDWYVVAFVTPGQTPDAMRPTVCVYGAPLPFHQWASQFETGLDAVMVDVRQVPQNCWPPELKCRSRMHYFLADREAQKKQPGARAILLDQDRFVGEGSTANVVAYFENRGLVTPLRSKVLPGVTQEVLYELASSLDLPHREADLTVEEFTAADEIYFVSTSICMLPVVRLDSKKIGRGTPGEVYKSLLRAWSEHVGLDVVEQAKNFSQRS